MIARSLLPSALLPAVFLGSLLVVPGVEALARFPAQLPFRDHGTKKPRRLEAWTERRGKVLRDAETHVETNQVGQAQGAHRMVVAELHGAVDVLGRGDAILHHTNGLHTHAPTQPQAR